MATVTLKNVYKVYENIDKKSKEKQKPAVSDFSIEIQDKEFIVFVGPSGCGKSTTLRMIAGLEEITDGVVLIDDKVVNEVEPKDRDIAMVFQSYALYPHMTVYDNIAFGLRMKKVDDIKRHPVPKSFFQEIVDDVKRNRRGDPILDKSGKTIPVKRKHTRAEIDAEQRKQPPILDGNGKEIHYLRSYTKYEIDEKVREAAKTLEITEYLKRKPKALSGGQRQRVAIGRAIVRKPKVFLMDEPLSNLDAKLRNQMRAEIIELRKKVPTTFIYVTHDQVEAMTLGDRIVIMKDGYIQQIGTPTEVFNNPANLFVAGFIGAPQMNFFDAKLKKCDGSYAVEFCGVDFALTEEANKKLCAYGENERTVVLGVRPEHISLAKDPGNCVKATVDIYEMMGSEAHVHFKINGKDAIIRIQTLGLDSAIAEAISHGGEICFTFTPGVIHLFDKETGKSLLD